MENKKADEDYRKIEELVNENINDLEEHLNNKLKELLAERGWDTQENLLSAREVFFKG